MTTITEYAETVEMLTDRVAQHRERAARATVHADYLRAQDNDTAADYWVVVAADFTEWADDAQAELDSLVAA